MLLPAGEILLSFAAAPNHVTSLSAFSWRHLAVHQAVTSETELTSVEAVCGTSSSKSCFKLCTSSAIRYCCSLAKRRQTSSAYYRHRAQIHVVLRTLKCDCDDSLLIRLISPRVLRKSVYRLIKCISCYSEPSSQNDRFVVDGVECFREVKQHHNTNVTLIDGAHHVSENADNNCYCS